MRLSATRVFESRYFFSFILLVNISLLFITRFYPSMDGPAHLYNANILKELIYGNEILSTYFSINSIIIPNWISTAVLAFFRMIFPAWLAEKFLLILYISGMAFSFRYLIKQLNPDNISLSLLIFPFTYSLLFHLGFYNFSISFIFYFLSVGYFSQIISSDKIYKYLLLFLLVTLCYFSNILIYGFLGLTLGLYIVYSAFDRFGKYRNFRILSRYGGNKILQLFILSLPSLILLFLFFLKVDLFPSDQKLKTIEIIKWLNDARPFIVYSYSKEEVFTTQLFNLLLVLFVLIIYPLNSNGVKLKSLKIKKADLMLFPVLLSLILLFTVPNGSSAGMMSDRYSLMTFIFSLVWIVARTVKGNISNLVIIFSLLIHFGLQNRHFQDALLILDQHASEIKYADKYINKNSIVLPINLSESWREPHFSNYLGTEKAVVILKNYEASTGWFPVKFNLSEMPKITIDGKNSISGMNWKSNSKSEDSKAIDYILLYGNMKKLNESKWADLNKILATKYRLIYNSEDSYVNLYELSLGSGELTTVLSGCPF